MLIHGSGPISRHAPLTGQLALQFGFVIPVFDELATALGEAGWVVLTYDKRSCGTFNGCAENAYPLPDDSLTTDTFADDASAAVEFLRTREEVNPDAVTVAGHSQGSTFVPFLLRDDPSLGAGIMLAAPFDSIDTVLGDQAAFVAEIVGPARPTIRRWSQLPIWHRRLSDCAPTPPPPNPSAGAAPRSGDPGWTPATRHPPCSPR